jgi:WD40 repeat protein
MPLDQVTAANPRYTAALSVAFRPDATGLAVVNGDGTISLWSIADGTETVLPYLESERWNGSTGSVSFDPRGGVLATTYDTPAFRLWDLTGRTALATLATGDTSWVAQIAFSPDGRVLATTSGNDNPGNTLSDGRLQLWDAPSRTRVAMPANVNTHLYGLAFSPDGKTLANLRIDGQITLWDVGTRTVAKTLASPSSGVTCIAISPDGRFLAATTETLTTWQLEP